MINGIARKNNLYPLIDHVHKVITLSVNKEREQTIAHSFDLALLHNTAPNLPL